MDLNTMVKLPRNQEFDFCLGKWKIDQKIYDPTSNEWLKFSATTEFSLDLDEKIIVEHWEGTVMLPLEGMTEPEKRKAISIRSFDPQSEQWNIYWIDNRSRKFIPISTGKFQRPEQGNFYADIEHSIKSRITWSIVSEESIRWSWSIKNEKLDEDWKEQWIMNLQRQELSTQ